MNIPHRIVRTIDGRKSYIFHVNRRNENVVCFEHQPTSLEYFATKNSTLLWEPGEEFTAVRFISIDADIVATVSPFLSRFKEFQKNGAEILYMPCPSMTQLRLMGRIYREYLVQCPSDEVIQARVKKYGPFIRIVLLDKDASRKNYLERQKKEIIFDTDQIRYLIKSENLFFRGEAEMIAGFSHRLARFVVEPNPDTSCGGYDDSKYECSTDTVVSLFRQVIGKLDAKDWKESLQMYNAGVNKDNKFPRTCFELLFSYYSTSVDGLKWKFTELKQGTDWKDYVLQLPKMVKEITKYEDMEEGVLYYPTDPDFPFVDMYYKEGQKLTGIQATTSKSHAKPLPSYSKFREKLGIATNDAIKLHMYYVMLPSVANSLNNERFPLSFFWKGVNKTKQSLPTNVQFYAILPPKDFEASFV